MTPNADYPRPLGEPHEVFNPETKQFERNPQHADYGRGSPIPMGWAWRFKNFKGGPSHWFHCPDAPPRVGDNCDVVRVWGEHIDGQADG
jgi:hypothetical protein